MDLWGDLPVVHPCPIHCPSVELREREKERERESERETAVKLPLQPCLDIPAGFLRAIRHVNNRMLECRVCSRSMMESSSDASGPCAPSKSNLSVKSTGSCGTKLPSEETRALSELHESIPVPSVDGSGAHFMKKNVSASLSLLVLVDQESWRISPEQVSLTHPAKHASPAHFDTFQPEVFSGVELVSRATYISRKRRNWDSRQRQSKPYKRAERDAERKLLAQPEISHEAARQPAPTISFSVSYTSVTSSPSYMAAPMCFSANSVEPSTLVAL